ncbi:MAG: thiamine pyrophosphate-dependent enzyme [Cytophagales bacterium]|nr:thiamine pyrophosphate-dependent enzyme [Cytophagales bacterium]
MIHFSGGRTYYSHPSLRRKGFPVIPHQSSATGMQAIPATGMAHGIAYLESQKLMESTHNPIVLCSLGDGSITEGEVAEAFQMAVLKKFPILYLIQGIMVGESRPPVVRCARWMPMNMRLALKGLNEEG